MQGGEHHHRYFLRLFVGDYAADTGHLTTLQDGIYFNLIRHYWARGRLPDDDAQLARITKLQLRTWLKHKPVLQDFFYDGWKHKKIESELQRMTEVKAKRSLAGQISGFRRAVHKQRL